MIHQIDIEYYGCQIVLWVVAAGLVWLCVQVVGDLINPKPRPSELAQMDGKQW